MIRLCITSNDVMRYGTTHHDGTIWRNMCTSMHSCFLKKKTVLLIVFCFKRKYKDLLDFVQFVSDRDSWRPLNCTLTLSKCRACLLGWENHEVSVGIDMTYELSFDSRSSYATVRICSSVLNHQSREGRDLLVCWLRSGARLLFLGSEVRRRWRMLAARWPDTSKPPKLRLSVSWSPCMESECRRVYWNFILVQALDVSWAL